MQISTTPETPLSDAEKLSKALQRAEDAMRAALRGVKLGMDPTADLEKARQDAEQALNALELPTFHQRANSYNFAS